MGSNSLAETIAEHLLGDFREEPYLPSERKLTEYYNCNRMTIRRALQILTERGLLSNSSRKRFFSEEVKNGSAHAGKKQSVVMVLSFEKELLDHTRTYMLGGITHEAARCGLKLMFRELTEAMLEKMTSCEDIDDGFDVAGYLVTGPAPLRLHDILSSSLKPCIINGTFIGEENTRCRIRFMEVRIDYAAVFRDIALRLLALDHRKILLAHTGRGFMMDQITQGIQAAVKQFDLPPETLTARVYGVDIFNESENVRDIAGKLASDAQKYSALVLPCGNVFGLEVVNALREKNIGIPADLSLAMVGCETDYFIPVLGISGVWADVRELGAFCVKELARQIRTGRAEYGISYFSTSFIDRGSLAKARKNAKITDKKSRCNRKEFDK